MYIYPRACVARGGTTACACPALITPVKRVRTRTSINLTALGYLDVHDVLYRHWVHAFVAVCNRLLKNASNLLFVVGMRIVARTPREHKRVVFCTDT